MVKRKHYIKHALVKGLLFCWPTWAVGALSGVTTPYALQLKLKQISVGTRKQPQAFHHQTSLLSALHPQEQSPKTPHAPFISVLFLCRHGHLSHRQSLRALYVTPLCPFWLPYRPRGSIRYGPTLAYDMVNTIKLNHYTVNKHAA
jgi:hypothetical protein